MAISNRFAIHSCAEAIFYDLVDGHAIAHLTTLKDASIESTSETVYARGGRGKFVAL